MTGVILAGGRATRMQGRRKGFLPLGTEPCDHPLGWILRVFEGRFARSLVVVAPGAASDLAGRIPEDVAVVADRIPGCGPLGGLHAALKAVKTPHAFVCGCDMPSLSGPLIDFLVKRVREGHPLIPMRSHRPEPLHALYPVSCVAEIERALRAGTRKMSDFLARLAVDFVSEEEFQDVAGAASSFDNINTPDDLERLRSAREGCSP
ncbi:MAG: molybdenum cofactor guanylyltransferase [Acidobacteriota bacterium]